MSACYQLYDEANLVFWSTNTSSFHEGSVLSEFISRLTVRQRRDIVNLHLKINAIAIAWNMKRWSTVLDRDFLEKMRGLETLQLCIQCSSTVPMLPYEYLEDYLEHDWSEFLDNYRIENLRWVPWKQVSVAVSDHLTSVNLFAPSMDMKVSFSDDRNIRYAEELQSLLLGHQTIASFEKKSLAA